MVRPFPLCVTTHSSYQRHLYAYHLYVSPNMLNMAGILGVMKWQSGSTLSLHIYHPSGMI